MEYSKQKKPAQHGCYSPVFTVWMIVTLSPGTKSLLYLINTGREGSTLSMTVWYTKYYRGVYQNNPKTILHEPIQEDLVFNVKLSCLGAYCVSFKNFKNDLTEVNQSRVSKLYSLLVILRQRVSSIAGRLPSKVFFHWWLSSIKSHLLPNVVFHQRLSSISFGDIRCTLIWVQHAVLIWVCDTIGI